MPAIGRDLGFGVTGFAWVMDAYSLAFTGTLLASGGLRIATAGVARCWSGICCSWPPRSPAALRPTGPALWRLWRRTGQGVGARCHHGAIALPGERPTPTTGHQRAGQTRPFWVHGRDPCGIGLGARPDSWRRHRRHGSLALDIFLANIDLCVLIRMGAGAAHSSMTRNVDGPALDIVGIMLLTLALGLTIESSPTT